MRTYVFGAGGHGKVVFDILRAQGIAVEGFIDSRPKSSDVLGVSVFPEAALEGFGAVRMVIALGANHVRRDVVQRIKTLCPKVEFINAIHPTAYVSPLSKMGVGNVVAAGAIVGPATVVGDHAVINTGAQLDHDCTIQDFVTIAPGAILGGTVRVGVGTYVAIGSVVRHGIEIGEWSVVGAGSVVLGDMPDRVVAFGSPCRVIRPRGESDPYL